jgi:uncharacterized membrane protein YidH (DUF202 family)
VDPEFQKALIVVLIVGLGIAGIGTVALYFVFRAFGGQRPASSSHLGLMAGLVAFIFAVCAGLMLLSYR